jgi:transposase-like protein
VAHGNETRAAARAAYVYQRKSPDKIVEELGISKGTFFRWKREALAEKDDWDKARTAARLSGSGVEAVNQEFLEDFVVLFKSTTEGAKNNTELTDIAKAELLVRLGDAYHKVMANVGKASPKLNKLSVAMEVLELLVKVIDEDYSHLKEPFMELLDPFSAKLVQVYG